MYLRMDSREECEQIISAYNGRALPNSSQALVVKFADGGSSKRKANVSSPDGLCSGHTSTDGSVRICIKINTANENFVSAIFFILISHSNILC